jgi:hypothetical protein
MKKEMVKPFLWGIALGAIVLLIVIFSVGWVVTSSTAQANAKLMAEKAVSDCLAPICIDQFQKDPNKGAKLMEMKKLDNWGENSRSNFVKKQGWATMPGAKEADSKVAEECSKRLADLK